MEQNSFSTPDQDRYGFARRFLVCTNQELVAAFNHEVCKENWVNGRADYLFHLHRELIVRELDCSSVVNGRNLSMEHRVTLVDKRLVV
ncbi:MAG: hypothetical protein NTV01_12350 [Bacteroidia bacterium]|nr:hypothetical protein [Bacteroidia bacterium]